MGCHKINGKSMFPILKTINVFLKIFPVIDNMSGQTTILLLCTFWGTDSCNLILKIWTWFVNLNIIIIKNMN